jgi:hypothetical protein
METLVSKIFRGTFEKRISNPAKKWSQIQTLIAKVKVKLESEI